MAISSGAASENDSFDSINVTPLTDVLLVLLIIFLITGSSITAPSHDIALPEVVTKEKAEDANVVIDVDAKGNIFVGNKKLEEDKLRPHLQALAKQKNTDRIVINADNKTPYKHVVIAMDAARKGGLINIALATEHLKTGEEDSGKPGVKVEVKN